MSKSIREQLIESLTEGEAETIMVQVSIGDEFEDVYVKARNEAEAIKKAKAQTKFKNHKDFRWAKFVV